MLVNDCLQFPVDLVALGEQFIQFGLTQHVAQRRLTDLRSRLHEVHHVYNGGLGIHYIEVDDRRYFDGHVIARNHLLWRHSESDDT